MSGNRSSKRNSRIFWPELSQKAKFVVRFLVILMAFLALAIIPSSAREQLINGKYRIVYSEKTQFSAYNSMVGQTDSTPWITACGTRCREGVIAANHLPIGTKVLIEGYGNQVFIVEDRMNSRYKKNIDIWMRSHREALKFGRRTIKYHILEEV